MIYDVVVIGAGLAGMCAALAAAEKGRKVLLAARGLGTLHLASGLINLVTYYPLDSRIVAENPGAALDNLVREHPGHPLAVAGPAAVRDGFSSFRAVLDLLKLPYAGSIEKSTMIPCPIGTLAPASLYPALREVDIFSFEKILVAGFEGHGDFSPPYVAGNLEKQVGRAIAHTRLDAGLPLTRCHNSRDVASFLEGSPDDLLRALASKTKGADLLLLPAVLGLERHIEMLQAIEEGAGCRVLEIPTIPPSVQGGRLAERLLRHCAFLGVEFLVGSPVAAARVRGRSCIETSLEIPGGRMRRLEAASFVLATGGILGEGLEVLPKGIRETVLNLPTVCEEPVCREDMLSLAGHGFSRSGVMVNESMQPLDPSTGEVVMENVFVCGATLAGFDPIAERNGHGVALVTGYKAGRMAAEAMQVAEIEETR
jgi:glycerol-3-phosphate dehydrogenase subunit B